MQAAGTFWMRPTAVKDRRQARQLEQKDLERAGRPASLGLPVHPPDRDRIAAECA